MSSRNFGAFPCGEFYPQVNTSQYPQGIYLPVMLRLNLGMDKFEHRRLRLLTVRDRDLGGSTSALANKIGRSASYVSRMLYPDGKDGKKRIAEDMVEVIEAAFGWGRGWMDSDAPIPGGPAVAFVSPISPTLPLPTEARPHEVLSPAAHSLVDAIIKADKSGMSAEAFNALKEMLRLLGKGAHPEDEPFRLEDPSH
ncbi:conserved protein of unknown function [Burkholderia multivorans]